MKKFVLSLSALFLAGMSFAQSAEIVVEKVDNQGLVDGETYRVYAHLDSPDKSLHAVFGEGSSTTLVETTTSFFQHDLGGYSTVDVNEAVLAIDPTLAFDSWFTIGAENATNNNLWTAGVEPQTFADGGKLEVSDGAWFLIPTDSRCAVSQGDLILLMQLTTTGVASGTVHIQGWDADHNPWQERDLQFSSEQAQVFGCMNADAANYNTDATFDDGSCEIDENHGGGDDTSNGSNEILTSITDQQGWQVFPNPIWEDQFNLQFSQNIDLEKNPMIVEVFDMSGKLVMNQEITGGDVIGGNKILMKHNLPAGNFMVQVLYGSFNDALQIVIQR